MIDHLKYQVVRVRIEISMRVYPKDPCWHVPKVRASRVPMGVLERERITMAVDILKCDVPISSIRNCAFQQLFYCLSPQATEQSIQGHQADTYTSRDMHIFPGSCHCKCRRKVNPGQHPCLSTMTQSRHVLSAAPCDSFDYSVVVIAHESRSSSPYSVKLRGIYMAHE